MYILSALPVVKPHVKVIIMEVLRLITKTHVDDLTPVVDSLLENFEEDVIPIAYDVAVELVRQHTAITLLNCCGTF